jgi:hypothetical protein
MIPVAVRAHDGPPLIGEAADQRSAQSPARAGDDGQPGHRSTTRSSASPTRLEPVRAASRIVTDVRLPSATLERLDELAGNDKGGRSGLIRQAIDEFLARHAGEAA